MLLLLAAFARAQDKPGSAFRFQSDEKVRRSIDLKEVRKGVRGEPRDGIPAIKTPKHAPAGGAPWVTDSMRVIGLAIGGEARAYPLYILQVHEMVDDVLGGVPVAPNY